MLSLVSWLNVFQKCAWNREPDAGKTSMFDLDSVLDLVSMFEDISLYYDNSIRKLMKSRVSATGE